MSTLYTSDWSETREHWPELFDELELTGKPNLRFLEIGCFEGQATFWLVEHVLTHGTARITVIDPFTIERDGIDQYRRFERNLLATPGAVDKVEPLIGTSRTYLPQLTHPNPRAFDFVYVDGDHSAIAVIRDAIGVWPLVKYGGAVLFDDYHGLEGERWETPTLAVDAFVTCFEPEIEDHHVVGKDQYLVRKMPF